MSLVCAVHQPQFLPWLGYFDKIDKSDVFVLLDNVQYKKNEWQNRNRIRTVDGWQWLTVPVKYHFGQKINEVEIDNSKDWRKKHWQALVTNYQKAPYFKQFHTFLEGVYTRQWQYLAEINIYLIERIVELLGINTAIKRASVLGVSGEKTTRLVNICLALGADTYLSGTGARDYLKEEEFSGQGIEVVFQEFQHPTYTQVFPGFELNMSIIDLLLNEGPGSLQILRGGI